MPRDIVAGLGRRVRERRVAQGMKLSALARKAGIATSYLSEMETTEGASPSAIVLYRIAVALETTVPRLLGLPEHAAETPDSRALPKTLQRTRALYRLSDDEVALLSTITYRGKRPQSEEDWFFLLAAIRRAVG